VAAHFFLQNEGSQPLLSDFATFLIDKCNAMIQYLNNRTLT
jgi:hypothetical protein